LRRDPPQLHKGSRTFGVAAGGCPASSRQGWREGLGAPAGPAFRQGAGLTADLSMEGEERFPPPPAGGPESRGPAATSPPGEIPARGPLIPRQGGRRFSGHSTITGNF
jgi:hypothetical protein